MPYEAIANLLRIGSQASFAVINVHKPDRDITVTKAISGDRAMVKLAARLLRFDVFAGGWKVDDAARRLLSLESFTRLGSLRDIAGTQFPDLALRTIERTMGIGAIYGRGFRDGGTQIGNALVFFPRDITDTDVRDRLEEIGRSVEEILAAIDEPIGRDPIVRGRRSDSDNEAYSDYLPDSLEALSPDSIVIDDNFVPDIYLGLDRDLNVVFANHAISELGLTASDAIGEPASQIVGEGVEDPLWSEFRRVIASDRAVSLTWPHELRTHSGVHFRATYVRVPPEKTERDNSEVLTVVLRDVSKEHELAVSVVQREATLRGLIDAMSDAVWVESVVPRRVVFLNHHVERVLGVETAGFIADPDLLDRVLTPHGESQNHDTVPNLNHATQFDYQKSDGETGPRYIRIRSYPVSRPESPPLLIRIAEDVTEQRRDFSVLEAQLAQARMLVREMSHRVKNHLNLAVSVSSTASLRTDDPAVRAELRRLEDGIRSIALVHDRLHREHDSAEIHFGSYCNALLELLAPVTTRGDLIRVDSTIAEHTIPDGRATSLGLLVTELVTNAAKHAFSESIVEPTIVVEFETAPYRDADGYVLRVKDNGPPVERNPLSVSKDSLGGQIIIALAAQLDGELAFEQGPVWKVFSVSWPSTD